MSEARATIRGRVEIVGINDQAELERLYEFLQTLMLTRRGTLPGNRDYGMNGNYLDYVTPESINLFAVELDEAIARWIPGIRLEQVKTVLDSLGAQSRIQVFLAMKEDWEFE